jgi:hypothetical protein
MTQCKEHLPNTARKTVERRHSRNILKLSEVGEEEDIKANVCLFRVGSVNFIFPRELDYSQLRRITPYILSQPNKRFF